ncbi:class I lanthipeptide [Acidobacteriota bacterium]
MKSKRLRKKPVLNKKTVANLKDDEMKKLKGGEITSTLPLVSCVTITTVGG